MFATRQVLLRDLGAITPGHPQKLYIPVLAILLDPNAETRQWLYLWGIDHAILFQFVASSLLAVLGFADVDGLAADFG